MRNLKNAFKRKFKISDSGGTSEENLYANLENSEENLTEQPRKLSKCSNFSFNCKYKNDNGRKIICPVEITGVHEIFGNRLIIHWDVSGGHLCEIGGYEVFNSKKYRLACSFSYFFISDLRRQ